MTKIVFKPHIQYPDMELSNLTNEELAQGYNTITANGFNFFLQGRMEDEIEYRVSEETMTWEEVA